MTGKSCRFFLVRVRFVYITIIITEYFFFYYYYYLKDPRFYTVEILSCKYSYIYKSAYYTSIIFKMIETSAYYIVLYFYIIYTLLSCSL